MRINIIITRPEDILHAIVPVTPAYLDQGQQIVYFVKATISLMEISVTNVIQLVKLASEARTHNVFLAKQENISTPIRLVLINAKFHITREQKMRSHTVTLPVIVLFSHILTDHA